MKPGVFIDNVFAHGSLKRDCVNPATGAVIASCSTGSANDIDAAVASALRAFRSWSTHDAARQRGIAMAAFADLVEQVGGGAARVVVARFVVSMCG